MPRLRPYALIVLLSVQRWIDQPSLIDLCRDRCGLRLHRPRRLAWNILFAPLRDRPGPIDRAGIAATAASTATPAVVSPTAAEGTVAASLFAAEGTEALSPRPPPKRRAEGTPSPATWWSARAGLFPGPLPGPPPGPGVSHPVFGPCGKQMVRWLVWIQGLWSAQRLCPCADPRAILCRTVLWTARAHYPRGTSRV